MSIKRRKFQRLISSIMGFLLVLILFAGCGAGGNATGGGNSPSSDPGGGNTWDEMEWDRGQWA